MGEQRKYRSWTAPQKIELVRAGPRGDRTVREVCLEREVSERLYYGGVTSCSRVAVRRSPARTSATARRSCDGKSASWSGRWPEDVRAGDRGLALRGWE